MNSWKWVSLKIKQSIQFTTLELMQELKWQSCGFMKTLKIH